MTEKAVVGRTVQGAGWIIAWRLVSRNLGLISTLLLVRLLNPSDFGLVALATSFTQAIDAISSIGVQDALVREPNVDRDLYDTGFGLSVLRAALTASIVLALAWPAAVFFSEPRLAVVLLVLAFGTLASGFENIGMVDFRRTMAFRKEFDVQVWSRLISVITTISVAFIFHSYWALVAGIVVLRLMRLGQSYIVSPYRPRFTIRAWRRLLGFSFWTWCLTVLLQLRDRSDSIIIGRILGTAQVGTFSVGSELGSLPTTELIEPLNRALFSGFAALQGSTRDVGMLFLNATGLAFLIALPAGIGISLVANPLVLVTLGPRWTAGVPVVEIMGVASAISLFGNFAAMLLNSHGVPRTTFTLSAVSAALRIPLVIIFLRIWGLSGAAAGVTASLVLDQIMFLRVSLPRIGVRLGDLGTRLWRPLAGCAVMIVVLHALGMAWAPAPGVSEENNIATLLIRSSIGALTYVGAVASFWFASGRPEGAEAWLIVKAGSTMRVLKRRWGAV